MPMLTPSRQDVLPRAAVQTGPDSAHALLADINRRLDRLLAGPAFKLEPRHHHAELLPLLQSELAYAAQCNAHLRHHFEAWPIDYRTATRIADLPYLPVGVFKANPPLALVMPDKITRTLASSATTGQTPSRVVLDADTSKRMTKGVMTIIRDFIGPMRRPYLVIDTLGEFSPAMLKWGRERRRSRVYGLLPLRLYAACRKTGQEISTSMKRSFSSLPQNGDRPKFSFTDSPMLFGSIW